MLKPMLSFALSTEIWQLITYVIRTSALDHYDEGWLGNFKQQLMSMTKV